MASATMEFSTADVPPIVGATTVNWVSAGYSTAVKNQGGCGELPLQQIIDGMHAAFIS